jgi:hypothetical protein
LNLEVDDSIPDTVFYSLSGEIAIPALGGRADEVSPLVNDVLGDDLVAGLASDDPEGVQLDQVIAVAGPPRLYVAFRLPGKVNPLSVHPDARIEGDSVMWEFSTDDPGLKELRAVSIWRPADSPQSSASVPTSLSTEVEAAKGSPEDLVAPATPTSTIGSDSTSYDWHREVLSRALSQNAAVTASPSSRIAELLSGVGIANEDSVMQMVAAWDERFVADSASATDRMQFERVRMDMALATSAAYAADEYGRLYFPSLRRALPAIAQLGRLAAEDESVSRTVDDWIFRLMRQDAQLRALGPSQ